MGPTYRSKSRSKIVAKLLSDGPTAIAVLLRHVGILGDVLATLISRELKKRIEGTNEETDDRGHLKRDCPIKKSSGFVKKGKRDQDSDSFDGEGNAYFAKALVVVGNDEMTELVMDSGDNRTCTIKGTWKMKIQLHDGSSFILEDVRYVLRLRKSLILLGTLEKEGYTVKMQMGKIKFEVELQGSQGNREAEVFQVSNDDAIVAQRWLKDKQLEEKTNMDCLVKVGANITVTGVPGQEGAE
ncbi:hypothetical protein Tco_0931909, partial [Tanacetum coccineum]